MKHASQITTNSKKTGMVRKLLLLLSSSLSLMPLVNDSQVSAATISSISGGSTTFTGQSTTISVPRFDDSLGTLVNVRLLTTVSVASNYTLTNNTTQTVTASVTPTVGINFTSLDNLEEPLLPNPSQIEVTANAGYNYSYVAGVGYTYNWLGQIVGSYPIIGYAFSPGQTSSSYNYLANGTSDFDPSVETFVGTGMMYIDVSILVSDSMVYSAGAYSITPDYQETDTTIEIVYEYQTVPEPSSVLIAALGAITALRRRRCGSSPSNAPNGSALVA